MSHFEDLAVWPLAGRTIDSLRAVGWLERGHSYPQGEVTERFFERLLQLLVQPWQPATAAGRHTCSLCRFSGGPGHVTFRGVTITMGASNVFVPGDGVIYVAPSLVAHYVDSHEYSPPAEFVEAVLRCPPMRSMPYLRAIKAIGGNDLTNAAKAPFP
jgi:hypothetical protein